MRTDHPFFSDFRRHIPNDDRMEREICLDAFVQNHHPFALKKKSSTCKHRGKSFFCVYPPHPPGLSTVYVRFNEVSLYVLF